MEARRRPVSIRFGPPTPARFCFALVSTRRPRASRGSNAGPCGEVRIWRICGAFSCCDQVTVAMVQVSGLAVAAADTDQDGGFGAGAVALRPHGHGWVDLPHPHAKLERPVLTHLLKAALEGLPHGGAVVLQRDRLAEH